MVRLIILLLLISARLSGQPADPLAKNRWIEKRLGLASVPNTNDIVLRIFLGTGITNGGHVIEIIKVKGVWTGAKYDYFLKIRKGNANPKIKRFVKTDLRSSNWDALWMELEKLDLLTLPSQDDIKDKLRKEVTTRRGKGYEVLSVLDGSSYDLIVQKGSKVSQYSFHSPWVYADKYPNVDEVRKYSSIIDTLEKEFQIKFGH